MCCWSASRSGGHIGAVLVQFLHEGGNRRTFVSGLVARGQAVELRARFPDLQSMLSEVNHQQLAAVAKIHIRIDTET